MRKEETELIFLKYKGEIEKIHFKLHLFALVFGKPKINVGMDCITAYSFRHTEKSFHIQRRAGFLEKLSNLYLSRNYTKELKSKNCEKVVMLDKYKEI